MKKAKDKKENKYGKYFGRKWGPAIIAVLRLIVGAVFLFSGFTKGIDPWGSVYKFDEYLNSFGFYDYDGLLLFMAFSVSAVEFVLGMFMLLGIYRRFTPVAMLLMMAVMLPLTLYIAITNDVADCGCFGDAVTISNWGTFWKNVALTLALTYLLLFNKHVKNIYGFAVQWIVAFISFAYILSVAWIGYSYQPLLDFRPFPVGTVISPDAAYHEGNSENFMFVYEKNGISQEFTIDSLPDETWTFVDRIPIPQVSKAATDPAIFRPITVMDIDHEIADGAIIDDGEQLLLLFPSLSDVVIPFTYLINETCDFCHSHGIDVVGLTSNGKAEIDEWNDLSMADYPMYVMDDSELKMLARGNPAAVFLRNGKIEWKRTMQSIPVDNIDNVDSLDQLVGDTTPRHVLYTMTAIYLAAMLLVLIINRTHIVVKFSLRRVRKNRKKQVNLQQESEE